MDAHPDPVADIGTNSTQYFTELVLPDAVQATLADEFKAHQPAGFEQLQPEDRIHGMHASRTCRVVHAHDDGSAAVHRDDREPQPEGPAHERIPRLPELEKRPDPAAAKARRKDYCRELGRVIARYADDAEVIELARALEGVSASILSRRYCPGLNAACYEVFRRYGMKGGVQ